MNAEAGPTSPIEISIEAARTTAESRTEDKRSLFWVLEEREDEEARILKEEGVEDWIMNLEDEFKCKKRFVKRRRGSEEGERRASSSSHSRGGGRRGRGGRQLISSILVKDLKKRFVIREIKKHPWFVKDLREEVNADLMDKQMGQEMDVLFTECGLARLNYTRLVVPCN